MVSRLRCFIGCYPFSRWPRWAWFLVASPLLWWAFGCSGWIFAFPFDHDGVSDFPHGAGPSEPGRYRADAEGADGPLA
jgi:hypothetical protein